MNIDHSLSALSVARTANPMNSGSAANSSGLTTDTFFQLLAAQLQHQDPMEGMDSTQMILQMAQFATLESLNTLNNSFATYMEMSTIQDGAAMVGKEVRIGLDDGSTIVGRVDSVGFSSSGTLLRINGELFELWRIIEIGEEGSLNNTPTESESNEE